MMGVQELGEGSLIRPGDDTVVMAGCDAALEFACFEPYGRIALRRARP
jgi:hypothetical protein